MINVELNEQQIEFIIENFKEQLSLSEEGNLNLSKTSELIMEATITALENAKENDN